MRQRRGKYNSDCGRIHTEQPHFWRSETHTCNFKSSSKVENTVLRIFAFSFCLTVFWGGDWWERAGATLLNPCRTQKGLRCNPHARGRITAWFGRTWLWDKHTHTKKKMTRVSVSTKAAVTFYFIFVMPESLSRPSTGLVFARFNGPDSAKKKTRCDYSNLSALHANTDFSFQQHGRSSHVFTRFPLISAPANNSRKNKTAKHSAPRADCTAAR